MRKYVFRTLAFAALFCLLLTAAVFAEDAEITGNDVNFRSGPGTEYAIFDCLPKGTVVSVTDRSNGEWYGVTYGGRSGYIYASYLKVSSAPAETPVETGTAPSAPSAVETTPVSGGAASGTVNAMYVRFRSGPSTDYSIFGEYNSGTVVTVTAQSGEWYAVTIGGKSGYMYADYIDLDGGSVPIETPVPTPEPTPVPTPAPSAPPPADVSGGVAGHISGSYVYFRTGPDTTYSIYDTLDDGTPLVITGTSGNWRAVTINGRSGYVYSAYVVSDGGAIPDTPVPTPEPYVPPVEPTNNSVVGYITGNSVRFRSGPGTRYDILGELNYGNTVTITGSSGEWKAVIYNGESGYVYGQYVAEGSITTIGDSPNSSELGNQIVAYALQFEGCPYVWGGTSPAGFDCSGFTTYVYGHFGITLNRVADDQTRNGVAVDVSALQPGDLLCFYSGGNYVGHVGIYIGHNRFIHASTYITGVIISELSGYYDARGFIARRLV